MSGWRRRRRRREARIAAEEAALETAEEAEGISVLWQKRDPELKEPETE